MSQRSAIKRFEKFHRRRPDAVKTIDVRHPKALVYLGRAVAIEYESDKRVHKSDVFNPKTRTYRHELGAGVMLCTDETGRVAYIRGGKFRVTDWLRD